MATDMKALKAMFTHPALNAEQLRTIKALELSAYNQAILIIESCPENDERELALRSLQQSMSYVRESIYLSVG